jgi:hypothetical protein
MKTPVILSLVVFCSAAVIAQPTPPAPPAPPTPVPSRTIPGAQPGPSPAVPKDTANYRILVKWSDAKAGTNSLQVLTAEGSFSLDTIHSSVRINDSNVPTTVSFNGNINFLSPGNARLKVFLGRTVPYVTSTYSSGPGQSSSSYQQMRVGFDSAFTVTFGKPLVIQADQNGEISVLVKREEN